MTTPIHKAKIERGRIVLEDKNAFAIWLDTFKEKEEVEVIVRKQRRNRTDKQNSKYWAYLNLIEEETGTPAEDTHELAKRLFLPRTEKTIFGKKLATPNSTTTLTTKEFSDYLAKIEELTGIPIPDFSKISYE